jgi:hypothetical protein
MDKMVEFNEKKMRKELIDLYEAFLKNPKSKLVRNVAIKYSNLYGGLSAYNDILAQQPIPKDIENALGGLSTIYQYGIWGEYHEAFSDEKIIKDAKKILEELREKS